MRHGNTVTSNYVPVPQVRPQPGPRPEQVPMDRFIKGRWSGSFTLSLTTIDPVRVGSNVLFPQPGRNGTELVQDLMLRRGVPIIPGSSLKGTTRQLVEALGGGCNLTGSCREFCIACSMFGTIDGVSWKGRVGFDDALATKNHKMGIIKLPRAFAPRRAVGRRIYGAKPVGVEGTDRYFVLTRGSVLSSRLQVTNLSDAELGLLLHAIGADGTFAPRLGGGKFYGLGRTRFTIDSARLRSGPGRSKTLTEDALEAKLKAWLATWKAPPGGDGVLKVLRQQMGVR